MVCRRHWPRGDASGRPPCGTWLIICAVVARSPVSPRPSETAAPRTPVRWFLTFTADRVALARASVETEQDKDVWDLRLWGGAGWLSFTGGGNCHRAGSHPSRPSRPITQAWLKAAAKAWAAEALVRKNA